MSRFLIKTINERFCEFRLDFHGRKNFSSFGSLAVRKSRNSAQSDSVDAKISRSTELIQRFPDEIARVFFSFAHERERRKENLLIFRDFSMNFFFSRDDRLRSATTAWQAWRIQVPCRAFTDFPTGKSVSRAAKIGARRMQKRETFHCDD